MIHSSSSRHICMQPTRLHFLLPFKYFLRMKTFSLSLFSHFCSLRCKKIAAFAPTHSRTAHAYATGYSFCTAFLSGCSRNGCHCEEVKEIFSPSLFIHCYVPLHVHPIHSLCTLFLPGFSLSPLNPIPCSFHSNLK